MTKQYHKTQNINTKRKTETQSKKQYLNWPKTETQITKQYRKTQNRNAKRKTETQIR